MDKDTNTEIDICLEQSESFVRLDKKELNIIVLSRVQSALLVICSILVSICCLLYISEKSYFYIQSYNQESIQERNDVLESITKVCRAECLQPEFSESEFADCLQVCIDYNSKKYN